MRAHLLLALAVCALSPPALAHGMRTGYLELSETGPGRAIGTWKMTVADPHATPRVRPPCALELSQEGVSRYLRTITLTCPEDLAAMSLSVEGLGPLLNEAVVRVARANGSSASAVLTPGSPAWSLPRGQTRAEVAREYVGLGMLHILTGLDHLLFLLALVLLKRPRAVLLAESAFTLSHSVSFAGTALGVLRVPSAAAEACIALSLVLVALDVARPGGRPTGAWRGAGLALVFGLVHGLGFAGSLAEVGVPQAAVLPALVGFGLGVEVGQLAFLLAVLGAAALLERRKWLPRAALASAYGIGGIGAYWFIGRGLAVLSHQL